MQQRFEHAFLAGSDHSRFKLTRPTGARGDISCDEIARGLPSILDGGSVAPEGVVEHIGACLRCQAELARYHTVLRLLNQLRAHRIEPPPGAVADVLGALEEAAQRRVIRFALNGRRLAYAGAFAAPAAVVLAMSVARRGRLRRVGPVVLS